MNPAGVVILLIVAALIIIISLVSVTVRRRRMRARESFGLSYKQGAAERHDRDNSERVLRFRKSASEKSRIRPLSPTDRASFRYRWNEVQSDFVEDPNGALVRAQNLVTSVMQARGYPVPELDQAADLSAEHPIVVDNYRAVREIGLRHSRGQATAEDLRQAVMHYRALFQELIEDSRPFSKGA